MKWKDCSKTNLVLVAFIADGVIPTERTNLYEREVRK